MPADTRTLHNLLLRLGMSCGNPPQALLDKLAQNESEVASHFNDIITFARTHTVQGVVSDGLSFVSDAVELPDVESMKLAIEIDGMEAENAKQNKVLAAIGNAAKKRGIRVVLQKGQNSAALYPEPSHRACGDIDLYMPDMTPEEFGEAMGIPKDKLEHDPDGGLTFTLGDQIVELHRSLMDVSRSNWDKTIAAVVAKEGYVEGPVDGILAPGPVSTLLMLNTHILKHAMGHGIGLRQFCDLYLAYQKWGSDEEVMGAYRKAIADCGLTKWTESLDMYLDSLFNDGSATKDSLFEKITEGGNFGRGSKEHDALANMSSIRRKIKTFGALMSRAGFGLRFAPREYCDYIAELVKGQLS